MRSAPPLAGQASRIWASGGVCAAQRGFAVTGRSYLRCGRRVLLLVEQRVDLQSPCCFQLVPGEVLVHLGGRRSFAARRNRRVETGDKHRFSKAWFSRGKKTTFAIVPAGLPLINLLRALVVSSLFERERNEAKFRLCVCVCACVFLIPE